MAKCLRVGEGGGGSLSHETNFGANRYAYISNGCNVLNFSRIKGEIMLNKQN